MPVVVYTKNACPICAITKRFLEARSIEYTEINVQESPECIEQIAKRTGAKSIPVTEIDGSFVIGFQKEKLENLLKIAGKLP